MSTTKTLTRPHASATGRMPATMIGLAALLGLLAVGAVQGGVAMVRDPYTPLGMSTDFLDRTPIDTYFLAGWFLLGIAAASTITMAGLVFRWRWSWASGIERAVGHRWPWLGSVATGAVLLAFEIIELFMVPFHPVMHPLMMAVSVILVVLPSTRSGRRYLGVTNSTSE